MNIKQAKDYIRNTIDLYLKKDEYGEYRIPVVRQRPVFLLGAPGVGKTAIMEQIAQELGIALVSYSMTHHTRQSALGLPFIEEKEYEGERYQVSEYTMSEIIASIYDVMRDSGIREGILFLDEINCVSETLAPSMLQFLQYKVFGRHKVPEGWVIVTAGNPPEYNKSVREFDIVTMDRLKILDVEADYGVWKEYAVNQQIHNVITSYLELKKEHFYLVETTVRGRSYVTARGWEDLSQMILLYEEAGLPVDETLVGQYLRNERVVKEFTAYYDLYNKYKKNYHVDEILDGKLPEEALARAHAASFDERLSLLGMLIDRIQTEIRKNVENADWMNALVAPLKALLSGAEKEKQASAVIDMLEQQIESRRRQMDIMQKANSLSDEDRKKFRGVLRFLEETKKGLYEETVITAADALEQIRQRFDTAVAEMKKETGRTKNRLHSLFVFVETAFEEGNEMLILVTELTVNTSSSRFIAMFGSEDYRKHNESLRLSGRQEELLQEIEQLEL